MTRDEAHALLDAARAGEPVTLLTIRRALWATGDLRRFRIAAAPGDLLAVATTDDEPAPTFDELDDELLDAPDDAPPVHRVLPAGTWESVRVELKNEQTPTRCPKARPPARPAGDTSAPTATGRD